MTGSFVGTVPAQLDVIGEDKVPGILRWNFSTTGTVSGTAALTVNYTANAELPIQIKVVGDYLKFGTFVSGLASLPRIVTVHNIKISRRGDANSKGKDELIMDSVVKTYRYLEEGIAEANGQAKPTVPATK